MALLSETIFRKTAAGQAALSRHDAAQAATVSLTPRLRALLVMVNGRDAAGKLLLQVAEAGSERQAEARQGLRLLQEAGWIEAAGVAVVEVNSRSFGSRLRAGPDTAEHQPPEAPADAATLAQARQALMPRLLEHFGPDAPRVAQRALQATGWREFNAGLDDIAARLAIHMGRKAARALLADLHH
ncbi:hypothetical protein [Ideonella livida]|uniref:Uncharacterized protein n=1 Tax=Ideonella livida TaxID=2707176 RepID=A0A7C9TGN4_9BURK|nr:hypothetical protein [Ideonella livida]NDY89798.1 hypothetical protein [Ideonella livida]